MTDKLRMLYTPEDVRRLDIAGVPVTDSTGRPGLFCSRAWVDKEPVLDLAGASGYTEIDDIDYPLTVCPYYSQDKGKLIMDPVKEYDL